MLTIEEQHEVWTSARQLRQDLRARRECLEHTREASRLEYARSERLLWWSGMVAAPPHAARESDPAFPSFS